MIFNQQRDLWREWHGTECTPLRAFKHFAEALKCKTALDLLYKGGTVPEYIMGDMPRRNNNLAYMWNVYSSVYRKRLGANYWAVYNAMTDWSTHFGAVRQSSQLNIASIQNDRQQLIRQAVNSHPFLKAA